MLRNDNTRLQAPKGRDARPSYGYSDAGGGHRIDAPLRLGSHRLRRVAIPHNADGGSNRATTRRLQVTGPHPCRSTANREEPIVPVKSRFVKLRLLIPNSKGKWMANSTPVILAS